MVTTAGVNCRADRMYCAQGIYLKVAVFSWLWLNVGCKLIGVFSLRFRQWKEVHTMLESDLIFRMRSWEVYVFRYPIYMLMVCFERRNKRSWVATCSNDTVLHFYWLFYTIHTFLLLLFLLIRMKHWNFRSRWATPACWDLPMFWGNILFSKTMIEKLRTVCCILIALGFDV